MRLAVDGSNVMIRSHFAHLDLTGPDGRQTGAAFGVARRVREAVERFGASRATVYWDGGRAAWRRELYPEYKARKPSSERASLETCFAQSEAVEAILAAMGVDQVRVPGVEADDLIARDALAGGGCAILSTDRDFYQLVQSWSGADVRVYYGAAGDERNVGAEAFERATGWASPEQWLAYRVVNGDRSDNIPRVHGLSGEKRFEAVWAVLKAELGYAGDPVAFFVDREGPPAPRPGPSNERIRKRIAGSWGDLGRNAALMDLRYAATRLPPLREIEASTRPGKWSERALERQCDVLGFRSVAEDWAGWRECFEGMRDRRKEART